MMSGAIGMRYWWIFAIIAVVFMLALWMAPKASTGTCTMSCTAGVVFIEYDDWESGTVTSICPAGCDCCEITAVNLHVALDGWDVSYKCCNCVGSEGGLPDCEMPMGFIHQIFGLCK